jgi:hypothetical protein
MYALRGPLAAAVVVAVPGCGVADDRGAARAAAEGFYAGVHQQRGPAACDRLSPPAAEALEKLEDRACERAVVTLNLGHAPVTDVQVWETGAVVTFGASERAYLDRRAGGWKVTAAGCRPMAIGPDDCELED